MDEAVRLVCPSCDTIHKVRQLTPGKVYQCKKCEAGLVTLSPALWECPDCGLRTDAAIQDMSTPQHCVQCADAPAMQLHFVADDIPAASTDSASVTADDIASSLLDDTQQEKFARHLGQRLLADLQRQIQPDIFSHSIGRVQEVLADSVQTSMLGAIDTEPLQKKLAQTIAASVQEVLSPRIQDALRSSFGPEASETFAGAVRQQVQQDLSLTFDASLVQSIAGEITTQLTESLTPVVGETVQQALSLSVETELAPALSKELQDRVVESMADELHLAVTGLAKETLDRDLTQQLQETLDGRAAAIIQKTMAATQEPLLEELRQTRRTIPLWAAAILSLGGLVLILYLWMFGIRERERGDNLAVDLQTQTASATKVLEGNAEVVQQLSHQLEDRDNELKKLQEAASVWYARSEAMAKKLRAMGVDPESVATPQK